MARSRPSIDRSIVFTYALDLDAASSFFADTLELDLVVDQGSCRIFRLTDESYVGVCNFAERAGDGGPHSNVMLTLVTDQVDDWYEFLTAKGVEYIRTPQQRDEFGIYASIFRSPHGYEVEIQSFNEPTWRTPIDE